MNAATADHTGHGQHHETHVLEQLYKRRKHTLVAVRSPLPNLVLIRRDASSCDVDLELAVGHSVDHAKHTHAHAVVVLWRACAEVGFASGLAYLS